MIQNAIADTIKIAKRHDIVKQQVYVIRSRVLRRLRKMDIDWLEEVLYD